MTPEKLIWTLLGHRAGFTVLSHNDMESALIVWNGQPGRSYTLQGATLIALITRHFGDTAR